MRTIGRDTVSPRVRVIIVAVVAVVALYFVIAQPEQAAAAVRSVVSGVVSAFGQIATFVRSLFSPGLGG